MTGIIDLARFLQAVGVMDHNQQVLIYAEVLDLLPTFSGPTALQGLEDFQIQFEQICGDNDITKSTCGWVLLSKMEGEPTHILQ